MTPEKLIDLLLELYSCVSVIPNGIVERIRVEISKEEETELKKYLSGRTSILDTDKLSSEPIGKLCGIEIIVREN
jgi:CRISPR/Cas system-associated exonuclease Cas4 (RecB family)